MDANLRKKFNNPFAVRENTLQSNFKWEAGERVLPPQTPNLLSQSSGRRSDDKSIDLDSFRMSENIRKSLKQIPESLTTRTPSRQKVCRSLFSAKLENGIEKFGPEKRNSHKQSFCKEWLNSGSIRTPKRELFKVVELPVPETMQETDPVEIAICLSCLDGLLGVVDKVMVQSSFDFCHQLKPEVLEKFRAKITPSKVSFSKLPELLSTSIACIIETGEHAYARRVKKSTEEPSEISSLPQPSSSVSCTGKRKMIRGYNFPHCGRRTNQSYQEQAKEFQEIFSSKVRQIAEVMDCLQHKEVLFKILQL